MLLKCLQAAVLHDPCCTFEHIDDVARVYVVPMLDAAAALLGRLACVFVHALIGDCGRYGP